MKPHGVITIGTDHFIMKSWILETFQTHPGFKWKAQDASDWRTRPSDCFETKYEKRIRNLKVVSNLTNVDTYLETFRKSLTNTGFDLLDPLKEIKVPAQLEESVNYQNRSYFSTVIGLAFRKLDVFGYYKFVTAVKNINLLPDRKGMIKQKKMKAFV